MPQHHIALDDELEAQLETIRQQQGLETLDQAAEWLARRRLRKGIGMLTGRGRALYPVKGAQ